MDDVEAVLDDPHSHKLFPRVSAVEHHADHEALHDRARRLAEPLRLVTPSSVWKVYRARVSDGHEVQQAQVRDFNIFEAPTRGNEMNPRSRGDSLEHGACGGTYHFLKSFTWSANTAIVGDMGYKGIPVEIDTANDARRV